MKSVLVLKINDGSGGETNGSNITLSFWPQNIFASVLNFNALQYGRTEFTDLIATYW